MNSDSEKNIVAAAYLSGIGEAFKKAKSLEQNDLENYIEDAKVLRREFIQRAKNDGYESPAQFIEKAKQHARNEMRKNNSRNAEPIINARPSINVPPMTSTTSIDTTPPIITQTTAPVYTAPVYTAPITPMLTSPAALTPAALTPTATTATATTATATSTNIPFTLSPMIPTQAPTSSTNIPSETPKVNNAIASLVPQTQMQASDAELALGPAPAPEAEKGSFFGLRFGGKRKHRKTKKRHAKKHAKKYSRK